jgi:hypothetical protein
MGETLKRYLPEEEQVSARDLNRRAEILEALLRSMIANGFIDARGNILTRQQPVSTAGRIVWVKVTTQPTTAAPRLATVQRWDGAAMYGAPFSIEAFPNAKVSNLLYAFRPIGGTGVVDGGGGKVIWRQLDIPAQGVPFVVELSMTSGSANPVSWVYTVKAPGTNVELATGASPLYRPFTGRVPSAASRGLAYFTVDTNTLVLLQAYEVYGDHVCA